MAETNSVVGFIDLLGTKSSAAVSDSSFEDMLHCFYKALFIYLGVGKSPNVKAKIFSDCAYFYIEDFDKEYALRLNKMRQYLFRRKHFFKCAIVSGDYEETDARSVYAKLKDANSPPENPSFMESFVTDLQGDTSKYDDGGNQFWKNVSLVYFGDSSTRAYFKHEDFKGMGFSVENRVIEETRKKTTEKLFVESYFPSSVAPTGYKTFYDVRYPAQECITIFYNSEESLNGEGIKTFGDRKAFRDELYHLYEARENPNRRQSTSYHEDELEFVQIVIQSMYLASLKKKEYAQYYCSILNSIIVTSNFTLIHFTGELGNSMKPHYWELFPEVFYELFLKKGVLKDLCKIECFDLVIIVMLKRLMSELIRRETFSNEDGNSEIKTNAKKTAKAIMLLLKNIENLPTLINSKYAEILTITEKNYALAALADVSGPYNNLVLQ